MSVASRAREAAQRAALYSRRYWAGHPTWEAFRAWQIATLPLWHGPDRPLPWGDGGVPLAFPEPAV